MSYHSKYSAATLARMQALWENAPELSSAQIAVRFDMTKNAIIGHANRRGWKPRGSQRKTVGLSPLAQRLDAINARMDLVLAETRPFVEGRVKLVIADAELAGLAAE